MQFSKSTLKVVLLCFLHLQTYVAAHSWVEQLMGLAPDGTMTGQPGFPRGNVLRTDPGFGDSRMVFLIPPNGGPPNKIDANQLMCRPEQTVQKQNTGSPRLKATPGQGVALRYQENGHVTLLQNNPGKANGSGTNFVYLTTNPKPDDKFLQIHRQWTSDGNGGDRRGRLISTRNFDDGQCYQINGNQKSVQRQQEFAHPPDAFQGQALWCQQDVQIPEDIKPGTTVTLYWVWDWPTMPGTPGLAEGKQEIYTTCMDIDVVDASSLKADDSTKALKQDSTPPNLANSAVPAQFKNIANPTAINAQLIPFSGAQSATTSIQLSRTSSSNGNPPQTASAVRFTGSNIPASQSPNSSKDQSSSSEATSAVRFTGSNIPVSQSPSSSKDQSSSLQASSAARSAASSSFNTQAQETVTVTVTASATPSPFRFRSSRPSPVTVTATQTTFVTARTTRPAAGRRDVDIDATALNTDTVTADSTISGTLEIEATSTASLASTSGCSATEPVYRLRARMPFFILPPQDQPGSGAGAGC